MAIVNLTDHRQDITFLPRINPVITVDGDTYPIQAVLHAVSEVLVGFTDNGKCALGPDAIFGLSLMVDTCCAALEYRQSPKGE